MPDSRGSAVEMLAYLENLRIHWRADGDPAGTPVVFAHGQGMDLSVWDDVVALLPGQLRQIRYDLRGHGQSDTPPPPYAMGALIRDAESLLDQIGVRECVFVGLSAGGLVAQGLAIKRPDLVRGLVLVNTAVKMETPAIWKRQISAVAAGGMANVADDIVRRWFGLKGSQGALAARWRDRLLDCNPAGYAGVAAAIGGTDFLTPTSVLRLPVLCIAGSEDGQTPPDMVRELAGVIDGARFCLIRGAGHLAPAERPGEFASALEAFVTAVRQYG